MICHEARELLPLHLYADLGPVEREAVDRHLAECPACRAELAGLAAVRRGLDATPVPRTAVDPSAILRSEADRLRRRAGRWRLAALAATAAAAVFLAARLEVRVGGGQLVVRWGEPPAAPAPPAPEVRTVVLKPDPTVPPSVDERLNRMSELIRALAANIDGMDRQQREQLAKLRQEFADLRRQHLKRLSETERDVSALYTAQFGSRPSGVNP